MFYPELPYYDEHSQFDFPPAKNATVDGIVAIGGNLSPGMLLSAYRQGLFPWYSDDEDPILWWSPDPRFVLYPGKLHISRSMKRFLSRKPFTIKVDTSFNDLIKACAEAPRQDQDGTWITPDMLKAYTHLHELGYAHSVEVYEERMLVGGLYGVSIGSCFFGESMFSRRSNASKTALIYLAAYIKDKGFDCIDCQVSTPHLATLGAEKIPRARFLAELEGYVQKPTVKGPWNTAFPDFGRLSPT